MQITSERIVSVANNANRRPSVYRRCPYCGRQLNRISGTNVSVCDNPSCKGTKDKKSFYELCGV